MAFVVKDRVKETTTTTGTSDLVLSGSVSGFQSFSNALADGDTTYYALFEVSTNEWEVGVGTWTESTTTLARTTVLASSNSGSKVSLTAQAEVFISQPAGKAAFFDPSGDLTLVQDPTSNLQAATKQYVDTLAAAGLHYHDPVRVEQEGNLSATYSNGTAGVGATLTNNNTQAALTIDDVALSLNDRVLIYEQTNGYENGVYTVTNVGSASTNWVLTRATDADSYAPSDPDSLGQGDAFFVLEGTAGAGELYVMNTEGSITFGTTNITFTQVAATAVYSAGTGLTLTGTEFAADGANISNVDAVTLDGIDSSQFLRSDTVDTKTAGNLNFSDSVKAQFGDGSDLQIYHDGSHSYISDQGTGDLRVLAGQFNVKSASGNTDMIYAVNGGAVTLYNNGNAKLATTSTGVDITGALTSDGLTVDGTNDVALITTNQSNYTEGLTLRNTANWGYGTSLSFEAITSSGGSNAEVGRITSTWNTTGYHGLDFYTLNNNTLIRHMKLDGYGDFSLYEDTGTTAKFFWDASTMELGIGTDTPVNPLTVQQTSINWPYIALTNTSGTIKSQFGYQVNDDLLDIAANSGGIKFRTNNTETMRLTSAGNLGIGTQSPLTELDVVGATAGAGAAETVFRLAQPATYVSANNEIRSGVTSGQNPYLAFAVREGGSPYNTVERMRIDSSGNVGVGTQSPSQKLTINSGSSSGGLLVNATTADPFILLMETAANRGFYLTVDGNNNSGSNYSLSFVENNNGTTTNRMMITSGGNVGIGTTSPSQKLHVQGGQVRVSNGSDFYINSTSSNSYVYTSSTPFDIYTAGTSRMRVSSTGNVGIGTTSPSYKLEVAGSFAATTKSFVIDHPTKEGMKLRHGSLEGPEDGVYVRGRLTGETIIELPDYWTGLVHEDSITVQLTAMGGKADLWVESIADNKVTVGCDTEVDCFYFVQATRKDVDAWDVEYVADS
jgi:hypothetical protein